MADNDTRQRWVQKFDVAGALVWEVDLGPSPETNTIDVMAITVAPSGSILLTDGDYVLHKFDAAGNPLWNVKPGQYLNPRAMNDAGQIAGLSPGLDPGVHLLNPDGSLLWKGIWDGAEGMYGRADMNATGQVVLASTFAGASIRGYSAAGEDTWHDWDLAGAFGLDQIQTAEPGRD